MRREKKFSMEFEDIFWSGVNLDDLYQEYSENVNSAQVRIFIIGMREFNRVNSKQSLSSNKLNEIFERINNSMQISISREIEKLEETLLL